MQSNCQDIQNSFDRAKQAFRDASYPAVKLNLVNKAEEYDILSEVMQAISSLPDREYSNSDDAISELEGIQHAVQALMVIHYPVTKKALTDAIRDSATPSEVRVTLASCPDIIYNSFGDLINSCGSIMKIGCEAIGSSFDKAIQAFHAFDYPASKQDLIYKLEEYYISSEVMQAIRNLPDREYISSIDAIYTLECIRNNLQPFLDIDYPVSKVQLLEIARNHSFPANIIVELDSCPDILYNSISDLIRSCGGITQVGCEDIHSLFNEAMKVFQAVVYPVSRQDLINLAEEFDVHDEVMQVIWKLPNRKYNSATDAIEALEKTYRTLCNRSKI